MCMKRFDDYLFIVFRFIVIVENSKEKIMLDIVFLVSVVDGFFFVFWVVYEECLKVFDSIFKVR